MSTNRPILRVDNLKVDFPIFGGLLQRKINSVHAVRDVDFELFKGETLGIVGESGSGKTTIASAVKPLLENDGYLVMMIDGDEIRKRSHRHLGFTEIDIKQNNALIRE